ncbi:UNVERIFIED_ORG: DNA-binding LytR/AlgR family response regulator [Methylobacterium sp. SuP10 SLI 274]|uniref:hypothetical protein n=1 Tax=Methylorubrum extorquens TaxID=408 RepID=UPI00209DDB13|nr:hypothetical protein [Methylorubrum extorquens]MDF9861638.1 DNA-binding LytR/AlgR family response regulator [Methylorubrum pseudosasae]MDH6635265.1 DNA-binding LytR/AlgR family response regulator [Methylobacterium sp. SuP10 SLI 274]MDH6664435.1 DNA-binding LytR/AlgR family response regulator [Methylorubrum zatmanii]MCP1561436.1 DNA-binding LytR/AlgR family response regulator [Methylorubrum extorquens]MDF9789931.1 DNA-binding LytR/AlgR family response regulator [Methylorubrum extorquens]
MLDVNLGDARSYPVADMLFERSTPFLFATGYGRQGLEAAYQAVPVLQKPYQAAPLEHLLTHAVTCKTPIRKGDAAPAVPCACQGDGASKGRTFRADPVR